MISYPHSIVQDTMFIIRENMLTQFDISMYLMNFTWISWLALRM
jgi:hypothetical protein